MAITLAEREQRAEARAAALVGKVERVVPRVWAVPSQSGGEPHVVALLAKALMCDCTAAQLDLPCAHVAAVRLWLRARARVVAA